MSSIFVEDDAIETHSYAESYDESTQEEPIVVGYVFGPKKMSTMSVVMAEASKAKLSTTTPPPLRMKGRVSSSLTKKVISSVTPTKSIVFTVDGKEGKGALNDVLRFFSTNASGDAGSTGTCSASTTSHRTVSTAFPTRSSASVASNKSFTRQQYPVNVVFVPLDPDLPLEEQHGGKMDIILHKLTEDILCLSRLAEDHRELRDISNIDSIEQVGLSSTEEAAVKRVHRLVQFQKSQPACCVVDDPIRVQTLMDRSHIAKKLTDCLSGVVSKSGYSFASPKYTVIPEYSGIDGVERVRQQLVDANLEFPIIIKPLTAAGTKASHSMAIVLNMDDAEEILAKTPCLCQEYKNHDALLYKVYVLGDHVSVHRRRSLPNLPRDRSSKLSIVEFDSQRPYPRLSEFGYPEISEGPMKKQKLSCNALSPPPPLPHKVNEDELQPVVEVLRKTFGLELFGFDVLLASNEGRKEMLIVDVNYFPSYKEVPNFPILLARYLTEQAITGRQNSSIETKSI